MKHYIYFDKERVESLVAQIYGGIDESVQTKSERTQMDESGKSNGVKIGVDGSLNAILKKLKLSASVEHEVVTRNSVNELLGEIHTKILHDSIFDILISDLKDTNKFNPSEKKVGSFIRGEDELHIIDFEYLESFCREKSVVLLLKEIQEKEIREEAEKELEKISNEKLSNQQKQRNETHIKEKINKGNSEIDTLFKEFGTLISATKALLPYNRMALSSKGYLIPLEEKSFRENPNFLGLKYGGPFHYVGYITNILEATTQDENNNNKFDALQKVANMLLLNLLPTDANKIYVLHPLGIYFES